MRIITACNYDCPDGCSLVVDTDKPGQISIKGNPEHPYTQGFVCAKIRKTPVRQQSGERLTDPMIRVDGGWQITSWDIALELCAEKIQEFRDEPETMLHILGSGHKGVLGKLPQRLFSQLGAAATRGCLCDEAGNAAGLEDFGGNDMNDMRDLLNARHIVNWGRDIPRTSVHQTALLKKARKAGASVLTISPGGDTAKEITDQAIRVNPGCDRFLAAACVSFLLEKGCLKPSIITRTANWPGFAAAVRGWPLDELITAAGVSRADLERLAKVYGQDEPVASLVGWGLQRYLFGAQNVRHINALAMLSGNVGISGGGVYFGVGSMRNFNLDWLSPQKPPRTFSEPDLANELMRADPPVKLLWITGSNIVNQAPDSHHIAEAFAKIPFKVVVDGYMTDTASRADLVLPCALNLEQEDLVGAFSHNFVNYARPVLEPPPGCPPDHEIIRRLGQMLEPAIDLPDSEAIMRQCLDSSYLGISLEELREKGFCQAKRPKVAFKGLEFPHEDGLFHLPTRLDPEPEAPEGYPFRLLSLIRKEAIHSQLAPEEHHDPPRVWLSPDSPAWREFDPGEKVYLASQVGRMRVEPHKMPGLHPMVVIYRRDDWMSLGGGVNQIIQPLITDLGENAAYYSQHVRLEN
jgi:anaerobic selenocysteine-containing dehydrogenase